MLIKYTCHSKSQTLGIPYSFWHGPPVDRFHTKTGGRFAFTEYRCEVSFRGEILSPVQQPG